MADERWQADVTELMLVFVDALRALVPFMDKAKVAWTPREDQYDDFDRVAEALYRSFVISPALHDYRFAGLNLDDFRPFAFASDPRWRVQLEVTHLKFGEMGPLLDLDTRDEPFDVGIVDHDVPRVPVTEVVFGFRTPDGKLVRDLAVSQ